MRVAVWSCWSVMVGTPSSPKTNWPGLLIKGLICCMCMWQTCALTPSFIHASYKFGHGPFVSHCPLCAGHGCATDCDCLKPLTRCSWWFHGLHGWNSTLEQGHTLDCWSYSSCLVFFLAMMSCSLKTQSYAFTVCRSFENGEGGRKEWLSLQFTRWISPWTIDGVPTIGLQSW